MVDKTQKKQIPDWAKSHLNQASYERVEKAIGQAESETRAEIVPMVVNRSATVGHVPLMAGLILLVLFLAFEGETFLAAWLGPSPIWQGVAAGILLGLGWIVGRFAWVQRLFISKDDLEHQVNLRAEVEFYEAGLDKTEGDTGILLFVSLMEHRAVVLADKGIARILPPETWSEVVSLLTKGIKEGDLATGLERAIAKCGELVTPHFPVKDRDPNELRDHLVLKE